MMIEKLIKNKRLAKLLVSLLIIMGLTMCGSFAVAQDGTAQEDAIDEENISDINWDEGEEDSGTQSEDLSETNWDEGLDDDTTEEEQAAIAVRSEDRKVIEARELTVHLWGFLMFVGYLLGLVYTAYFTRNRKIAVHYAPELLIILHLLWPLEWISMVFAGKKVT